VLFLVAICAAVESNGEDNGGPCKQNALNARPHSVSILEFGAVGDGITLNTVAFQNAIFYLKSFADKGGAQLYVPSGTWLTGSFNLTSHLTLFLERGATIIASQVQFYFIFELNEKNYYYYYIGKYLLKNFFYTFFFFISFITSGLFSLGCCGFAPFLW